MAAGADGYLDGGTVTMMRNRLVGRCILAVAFFAPGVSAQEKPLARPVTPEAKKAPAEADVRGVWKVTELAWRAPGTEWEVRPIYLSQYIFTEKHYSYMYVPGAGPRKLFAGDPNKPTDAEKAEAYSSFIAGTGTFTLSGGTLVLHPLIMKNPNEMVGKPLTFTVEIDGSTLKMVIVNPPFLPGREARYVLTRIE